MMSATKGSEKPSVSYLQRPNGVRIGYCIYGEQHLGSKPPVVVFNALGFVPDDWESITPELTKSRPYVFFDYRGFNMSKLPPGAPEVEYTFQELFEDCKNFILQTGWRVIDMFVFSMGTSFGHFVLADPEIQQKVQIRHCIMASSGPQYPKNAELHYFRSVYAMFQQHEDKSPEEVRAIIKDGLQFYFDRSTTMDSPKMNRWADRFASRDRQGNIVFQIGAVFVKVRSSEYLFSQFPKSLKILVVQGELDRIVPMSDVASYYTLPQTRRLRVGNGRGEVPDLKFGHCWMEYHTPAIWASVLNDFLDDIDKSA